MIGAFLRTLVSSLVGRWLSSWWESRRQGRAAAEHVDNAVMTEQLKEVRDAKTAQTALHDGSDPALAVRVRSTYID